MYKIYKYSNANNNNDNDTVISTVLMTKYLITWSELVYIYI